MTRFNSVVLDVDSTLSGIEGIDWLASLRGAEVKAWSTELTDRAMRGEIPIEAVYGQRMNKVRPTKAEISKLADEYLSRIAKGARETLTALAAENVRKQRKKVVTPTGFEPVALRLGI